MLSSKGNGVIHGDVLIDTFTPYHQETEFYFYCVQYSVLLSSSAIVPWKICAGRNSASVVVLNNLVKKKHV